MGLGGVFQTGRSGMQASRAAIATTSHNISNANTEGYSRQRVLTETGHPTTGPGSKAQIGTGTLIARIERVNDEYVEKQVRNAARDLAGMEDKDLMLRQTEDIFNEMNGDGLNRLMSRFFNEFRKLANDPDNEAIRQSVRESSQALVNDFHRLRTEVDDVRKHIDSRLDGYSREVNGLADELRKLNDKIRYGSAGGGLPNDLYDQRDQIMKKLATYMDLQVHKDNHDNFIVDIKGIGPLVVGGQNETLSTETSPADDRGKVEGALDVRASSAANGTITHTLKGGKMGALLEVRDNTLSTIMDRLDSLAFKLAESVNSIHAQGFTRYGQQGVAFFKQPVVKERASEFIELSDQIKSNVSHIATAAQPDSPGDNRVAIAIANIQGMQIMNGGKVTMDDWFNSIVSDVGVATQKNRFTMTQQRDINTQLNKVRDQISGVSIDEETANLMQFQHSFDASAKVIQVADEMLKTVLELRR